MTSQPNSTEPRKSLSEPRLNIKCTTRRARHKSPLRSWNSNRNVLHERDTSDGEFATGERQFNEKEKLQFCQTLPIEVHPSPRVVDASSAENNLQPDGEELINCILDFVREAALRCKCGVDLYRLGYREIVHIPRVSNAATRPPSINPRHTKLSWRRVIDSSSRKRKSKQVQMPWIFVCQPNPPGTITNADISKHIPQTNVGIQIEEPSTDFETPKQNRIESGPLETEMHTNRRGASTPAAAVVVGRSSNNASAPRNTSEESFPVTRIPSTFQNARDLSPKEEEFLRRGPTRTAKSRFLHVESMGTSSLTTRCSSDEAATTMNTGNDHLMDRLTKLYNDLKALWLDVNEMAIVPYIHDLDSSGDHKLMLVNLCSFIVKEMKSEWKHVLSSATDKEKLVKLEETNRFLAEQAESARAMQACLEADVKFITKDKANMSEELKALSMRLADLQLKQELKAVRKTSSSSFGFELSRSASAECLPESHVQKRAADFNNLVDFVKSRQVDMSFYQDQFDKYNEQIKSMEAEINHASADKLEGERKYAELAEEHRALQQQFENYESMLALALKDKEENNNFRGLTESLMAKLQAIENAPQQKNSSSTTDIVYLEGSLRDAREQNDAFREEISQLRSTLAGLPEKKDSERAELEKRCAESEGMVEELAKRLTDKVDEANRTEEIYNKKEAEWEKFCNDVRKVKENMAIVLDEKDFELRKQMDVLHGYEKRNLRQEKRVQDMNKSNGRLKREIQDLKQKIETLNSTVHQLRSSLNEQKVQWTERVKAVTNDAVQAKDHCRWLQTQVEHLNSQIVESQERVKAHEKDKCNLALQILAIDEERKLIDEKLQELRSALQGDSAIRESLMERNATLQSELNRLRRARFVSMEKASAACDENANDDSPPPSEMSNMEFAVPPHLMSTSGEKGSSRRKCYTTALGSARRGVVVPRVAVSLTSPAKNSN